MNAIETVNNILDVLKHKYSQQFTDFKTSVFANKVIRPVIPNESHFDLIMVELLRFFYIKSHINDDISPSGLIDQVWHVLLLYPKFYITVCCLIAKQELQLKMDKITMNTIIDHNPLGAHDDQLVARKERYACTLKLLKSTFNDQHVFPLAWPVWVLPVDFQVLRQRTQVNDNEFSTRKRKTHDSDDNEAIRRVVSRNTNSRSTTRETKIIEFHVRDQDGTTYTFKATLSLSIERLMISIQKTVWIPLDDIRLFVHGERLDFTQTLADVIEDGDTIYLHRSVAGC